MKKHILAHNVNWLNVQKKCYQFAQRSQVVNLDANVDNDTTAKATS